MHRNESSVHGCGSPDESGADSDLRGGFRHTDNNGYASERDGNSRSDVHVHIDDCELR
jgi:hypothetical protein